MTVDAATFRHALGQFASGVTVVTMSHNGEQSALTVSAFSSLSLNPPYILACIDKASAASLNLVRDAAAFGVNILAEDQMALSNHFASKIPDKLANVPHHFGPLGSPLLDDVLVNLECRLAQEVDGGDHIVLFGEVVEAIVHEGKQPLLYYAGHYGQFDPV